MPFYQTQTLGIVNTNIEAKAKRISTICQAVASQMAAAT
jgi:hypothetical protein